jgi:DNA (cytosine-5)-methyltransferase 1
MDARAKDGVMRNQLGVGGINLASAEAIPLQEIGKRQSGTPMNGVGHGKAGDPMFTLQKSAQHGVVQPIAFAQNTRDEVRQINGDGAIAGALAGEPGMKQQTYVALPESPAASVIAFEPVIASRDGGHVYEEISGTLRKEPGDNRMTIVQPGNDARAGRMRGREGCAGGGKGPLLSEEKSLTLAANTNDQVLFQPSVTGPITAGIHKGMRGSEGVESNWMVPEVCGTLSDGAHNGGGLNGQDAYTGRIIPALGIPGNWIGRKPENGGNGSVPNLEHSPTLTKTDLHAVMTGMAVRRLTPRECERLQGFPDDFTAITYRGKPAADGPRYKALGNSMAVPNIRWILSRIDLIDQLAPFSTT